MNTRHLSRWFLPALAAVCLTVPGFADKAVTHSQVAKPNVATAGGLKVVTFTADPGTVRVNLPDDMRAGDTISGTVIAEPKGNTKDERGANQTELKKLGIRLIGRADDKPEDVVVGEVITVFKYSLVNDRQSGNVITIGLMTANGQLISRLTIPVLPMTPTGAVITPDPKSTAPPGMTPPGAMITPDPKTTPVFIIPQLGQTGRPIMISGRAFDGDSSNTKLTIGGKPQTVLAESPREVIVSSPADIIGSSELSVKEGDKETRGAFRNLKLDLTAPKTSLLKGESTELRIEVQGLEGLKQPVPLTIQSSGVITMVGGNYQPLVIEPSQVSADGRYVTTRGITGVQTGGWTATATVVTHPFAFCLQDDQSGNSLIFDQTTGDYIFRQAGEATTKPVILPWIAQTRGALVQSSDRNLVNPKVTIKRCSITVEHNTQDRGVQVQIDPCAHTGSASVQVTSPKVRFTITDRNISDNNVCAN